MGKWSQGSRAHAVLAILTLLAAAASHVRAHPGSGIIVDAQGQVYFVDTGQGVWKLDTQGQLTLIHTLAYHWMALDEKGHFAKSNALGDFDRGSFERITPLGAVPALIISSDYPVTMGTDGGLYYVPYSPKGPRELVRRTRDGQRSVFARLPANAGGKPMLWVNGIAAGQDGSFYVTDNAAIRKIGQNGSVSTFRDAIPLPDCADPLPEAPELPYLRGLAVAPDGSIYAAANGCRSVIHIPAQGPIRVVLKAQRPWSPTGVALSGKDTYVLEYLHTPGDNRKEWIPRVRKVGAHGRISTLATVIRRIK